MAITQETPAGVVVLPTAGPPGVSIVGPQGEPGEAGPAGDQGRPGDQGPAGAGALISRTATANTPPWTAIVADGVGGCRPADPSDPSQRQQVIAVAAHGGAQNVVIQAQNTGDLLGPNAGFIPGTTLFVGAGGVLTSTPPTSGWRQAVASAIAADHIVVNLGEATVIATDVAMVAVSGFSTPATASDVAQGAAQDRHITAALVPVLAAPGNPVGDAIGSKVGRANPALTGVSSLTGGGPTIDLITTIPANGTYTGAAGAGGAPLQAEPALGPFNGASQDLTRAQSVRYFTATGDANKGEYGTLLNMVVQGGFPTDWAPNTFYPQNGTCLNDGGKMYRVKDGTTGGTSAASGAGPTGTGSTVVDGGVTWRYEPFYTPGNGGKSNLTVMTYQDAGAGATWTAAFDQQIAGGGYKKNSFTVEIDLNNHWGDYNNPPYGPGAVALQIFTGGPYRSNAGLSIGQYESPSISTYALVNGIQVAGDTLVSDNTFADYTRSQNGIANFGHHAGSAFTDGSDSQISFNSYGGATIGFRHAGTSVIGLKLEGSYSAFQIQGPGWNVNGSGTVTATGVVTSNGLAFTTDATQDIGTGSARARNLYLANNPIVGSDQSLKTSLVPFTDAQLDAWGRVNFGLFQYLAAVAEKGRDQARLHAGVIAQQVVEALGEDAFRYGVVGRDLLWKTTTQTRKVQTQRLEPVEIVDTLDVVEDGRAVRRTVVRTEQRPVFDRIPIWHEDGRPVMTRRVRIGADGKPVPTHLPEIGADGESVMRPRPDADVYEIIQATHPQPAMIEVDEEYSVEVPDLDEAGLQKSLLNIRYDQLSVWEAAYQRRRVDRLETRMIAVEGGRVHG